MRGVCTVAGVGLLATAAQGQFVTFGFTDMEGSYDVGTGEYTAVVSGAFGTSGDVTRGPGMGTADYDPSFALPADVSFELDISSIVGNEATGIGTFEILDSGGDSITGLVRGTWTNQGNGFTTFDATLVGVAFADNNADDGLFDGPSGGSFAIDDLSFEYSGATSFLMPTPAGFFSNDFSGEVTLVDGIVVIPAPGAVGLLGIAGLVATRRRR